ncbi:MAG: HAD family hydrolase [Flavobacteriaceae bacterium]
MDLRVDHASVVVFDLDDTLYNELDFLRSAYWEIALKIAPSAPGPIFSQMFSQYRNGINVFEKISNQLNLDITQLIHSYRNHFPTIQLFDGALPLLEKIKSKNGKIGLVTDGRSITQRNKVKALGLTPFLDHIVISEELGTEKPNPENFRAIERHLPGTHYHYIADNLKKDFVAPKKMGWQAIALIDNGKNIHSTTHLYVQNEVHTPHYYIKSLTDIQVV